MNLRSTWKPGFRVVGAVCAAGLLFAGCRAELPPEVAAVEAESGEAVVEPDFGTAEKPADRLFGATRQEVVERCDFFVHYGLNGTMIAIGSGEQVGLFARPAEVLENSWLMAADSWRVDFRQEGGADSDRYSYDEVHFGSDGRVDGVSRGSSSYPAGI